MIRQRKAEKGQKYATETSRSIGKGLKMSDIKDNLYSQILSLNENEVRIFLALMQDKLLEESAAVPDITPPEGMTKADCKRLIKSIRTKQPYADARTQQYSLRVISHIRNVWVPQIKSHDQQAG